MIYLVTGWSVVAGDRAYVQAASAAEAIQRLLADLVRSDDADDRPPLVHWQAEPLTEPVCIIVWRD